MGVMAMKRWSICWIYGDSGIAKARRFSDLKTWIRTANGTDEDFSKPVAAEAAADVGHSHDASAPNTTGPTAA
jgi:hypothetical protein